MTLYSPSDTRAISLPNGCGESHARPDADKPWALDCAACEAAMPPEFGWAPTPDRVLPTWDEARQAEVDQERAQAAGWQRMAREMAGAAGADTSTLERRLEALEKGHKDEVAELKAKLAEAEARLAAAGKPADDAEAPNPPAKKATARKTTAAKA